MAITQTSRNQQFRDGVLVREDVVEVDVTAEVVEWALVDKVRRAVAGNLASIDKVPQTIANVQAVIDGSASNMAQANAAIDVLASTVKAMLNDYERVVRQLVALERLLVRSDLLDSDEGA